MIYLSILVGLSEKKETTQTEDAGMHCTEGNV
jgi:hypothetical protein